MKQLQWNQEKPGRWVAVSAIHDDGDPMQWVISTARQNGAERYQLDHDSWTSDESDGEDYATIAQAKSAAQRHEESMIREGQTEASPDEPLPEGLTVVEESAIRMPARGALAYLVPHLERLRKGQYLRVPADRVKDISNLTAAVKPLERAMDRAIDFVSDGAGGFYMRPLADGESFRFRRTRLPSS